MGTAEDQRVAPCLKKGPGIVAQQRCELCPVQITTLDALDQPRTGLVMNSTEPAKRSSSAAKRALRRVPVVASTPTTPLRVAPVAGLTAGSIPMIGTL